MSHSTPVRTSVPLLDLRPQYEPLRDQIVAAVVRVCDSQRYVMGPEIASFETEIAALLGVRESVAVSSGTDALLLALMALDIGPGDEVITSTFSFFATAGSIVRVGARPVLVDIDPVSFNIDPGAIESAITPRTKAVMPVHLFGLSADMDPIVSVATRAGVPIVEDAAQAIGATYRDRPVGGFGAAGCLSFFPSKNLGAFGDAGLLTTDDPKIAEKARLIRNHGMAPRYYHHTVGANFRMDEMQAAVLRVKAPHLPAWTEARRVNASRYVRLFQERGLTGRVLLPVEPAHRRHIFNQFTIRVPERDRLKPHLDARGIGNEIYYPVPFHRQPCFANLGYRTDQFPHADAVARECLSIPIYAELSVAQQETVVDAIAECLLDA